MTQTAPREPDDGGPVDLDSVADRLESALTRIAARLETGPGAPAKGVDTAALAARLDGLIGRLRDAVGHTAANGGAGG